MPLGFRPIGKIAGLDQLPPPFQVLLALGLLVVPGSVLAWMAHGARVCGGDWLGPIPGLALGALSAWLACGVAAEHAQLTLAIHGGMASPWGQTDACLLELLTLSLAFAAAGTSAVALLATRHTSQPALVWLVFAAALSVVLLPVGLPVLTVLGLARLPGRWLSWVLLLVTSPMLAAPFAYFDAHLPWSLLALELDHRATLAALATWLLALVVLGAYRMAARAV